MTTKTLVTRSELETSAAGRDLAPYLSAGSVVLLFGDLGAGKTAFVRGLAEGLGVERRKSAARPSRSCRSIEAGRLPLFHVDLYRLNDAREIEELGLDELTAGGVLAIEWADKLPQPPPDAVHVTFAHAGDTERTVTVEMRNLKC